VRSPSVTVSAPAPPASPGRRDDGPLRVVCQNGRVGMARSNRCKYSRLADSAQRACWRRAGSGGLVPEPCQNVEITRATTADSARARCEGTGCRRASGRAPARSSRRCLRQWNQKGLIDDVGPDGAAAVGLERHRHSLRRCLDVFLLGLPVSHCAAWFLGPLVPCPLSLVPCPLSLVPWPLGPLALGPWSLGSLSLVPCPLSLVPWPLGPLAPWPLGPLVP
jgi:hypothetical protein